MVSEIVEKEFLQTCCIGVELIESAVEDAKANARDNGISDELSVLIFSLHLLVSVNKSFI